jgi:ATP-dependent Clp protease adaptor protein ClpS
VGTERRGKGDVAVAPTKKAATPRRCRVLLFNDDYTTQEFVVHLLETLFRKSPAEAFQVMLKVHHEGRGVAGIYPHEVAETKVSAVHEAARSAGYPLRAGLEDE